RAQAPERERAAIMQSTPGEGSRGIGGATLLQFMGPGEPPSPRRSAFRRCCGYAMSNLRGRPGRNPLTYEREARDPSAVEQKGPRASARSGGGRRRVDEGVVEREPAADPLHARREGNVRLGAQRTDPIESVRAV